MIEPCFKGLIFGNTRHRKFLYLERTCPTVQNNWSAIRMSAPSTGFSACFIGCFTSAYLHENFSHLWDRNK